MISVIIPTLNAEARLGLCLDALVAPAMSGFVCEVIVVDGGSADGTLKISDGFGARILEAPPGRGGQLRAGADAARGDWLLFLHGDTVLEESWAEEACSFIKKSVHEAGVFTLAFDADDWRAYLVAVGAMLRTRVLKSPYGDQGLFISRAFYDEIGGYRSAPLFEDVDIVDRIVKKKGARALHVFKAKAVTSSARYERDGYMKRIIGNFLLLMRYRAGASPEALAKAYR